MPIFEQITVPSVLNQTTTDFKWIIMIGPSTPEKIREWIAQLDDRIRIVEISGFLQPEVVAKAVQPFLYGNTLVTIRVDNDDALARDYVERIHGLLNQKRPFIVHLINGLQLTPYGVLWLRNSFNPFVTVVEDTSPSVRPVTAMGGSHEELHQNMARIGLGGLPGWMQVIHRDNVINTPHGLPVWKRKWQKLFPHIAIRQQWTVKTYLAEVRVAEKLLRKMKREFPYGGKHND